jgi:hypothetical protein
MCKFPVALPRYNLSAIMTLARFMYSFQGLLALNGERVDLLFNTRYHNLWWQERCHCYCTCQVARGSQNENNAKSHLQKHYDDGPI